MTRSSLRLPKLPAAIMLLLLLAGCGFHLRDALLLPADLGPLRVVARDADSPLVLGQRVAPVPRSWTLQPPSRPAKTTRPCGS